MDEKDRRLVALGAERQNWAEGSGLSRSPVGVGGEGGWGWCFEEGSDGEVDAESGVESAEEAGGEEGVSAEFEEVVVDADGFQAEDVCEVGADDFFVGGAGGASGAGCGGVVGGGEGFAVEFAVGGERECVDQDEGGWDHEVGQSACGVVAQVVGVEVGLRDEVGDEAFVAGGVLAGLDDGAGHVEVVGQYGLDLAGFDAEAADLQLVVGTFQVFELSVGAPADEVAGAVHALTGAERAGHEPFRGHPRTVEVAAGNADPRDIQLSDNTRRHRLESLVKDVQPGIASWTPLDGFYDMRHVVPRPTR